MNTRIWCVGATSRNILIMFHPLVEEKKKRAKPRMRVSSEMDWISCRKRNFYNFVRISYTSGRCPSIRHSPLGSSGNNEGRHSANWIRSGNISCWPTDAVLSSIRGHCTLNSTVRAEVLLINSNYTLRYPGNTERTQCFRHPEV